MAKLSFTKRAHLSHNRCAKALFQLMEEKKTNLALAADVTSQSELLELADALGEDLAVLKTHVDILEDFTPDFGPKLRSIAQKHRFVIFEDRKFADIGQTVFLQYTKGIYHIAKWADIVNAHIVSGPGVIEGLKTANLLLLAEMSSSGTLAKGAYTKKAIQMAEANPETVMGFISLKKISALPGMIHFTPGVKCTPGRDHLGQKYRTIEEVLIKNQSDIIIVGRDITQNANPKKQAAIYREKAWKAHEKTIS